MKKIKYIFSLSILMFLSVAHGDNSVVCPWQPTCAGDECKYWPKLGPVVGNINTYYFKGAQVETDSLSVCIYAASPPWPGFSDVVLMGAYIKPITTPGTKWKALGATTKSVCYSTNRYACPFQRP